MARLRALPRRTDDPRTGLTGRQVQVLRLAANGRTNQSIARALGVSHEAVKSQMQSILRKLRASDRTHAVAVAIRLGVLSVDDIVVPDDANTDYRNAL
ncbi:hypothetical protein K701_29455 [Streptomyces fradiae ATCC 10745 = DSM 40063]|uniref:HTH luxR-type domain-containing protein n=1 Tax=Streptomyces fradiae ATCC 10745 = DSM 40063 TaxID=1319510 RepID=A0ABQ6XKJ1_STRFR|nr:LuxR C-terminal-related transcriptional regulator [Streptomyces fradiae]KAF0646294.1 hypothetical protein K701_29455 [Streptomyces fradiae ATCC 10745 = DSM 40063]